MGITETYRSTVLYACVIMGGEQALAERLGVTVDEVLSWLFDESLPPTPTFLKAVDIVLEAHTRTLAETQEVLKACKEMMQRIREQRAARKIRDA